MTYVCELGSGYSIYLENRGPQTVVTTAVRGLGQQQQSSSSFETGTWTAPPQVYRTGDGAIVALSLVGGDRFVQIRGQSSQLTTQTPFLGGDRPLPMGEAAAIPASSIPPMEPMQPMPPMKMGNMEMGNMEMRMGNMEMQMGSPAASSSPRRFCPQCGAAVQPDDRFCSSCGNRLA